MSNPWHTEHLILIIDPALLCRVIVLFAFFVQFVLYIYLIMISYFSWLNNILISSLFFLLLMLFITMLVAHHLIWQYMAHYHLYMAPSFTTENPQQYICIWMTWAECTPIWWYIEIPAILRHCVPRPSDVWFVLYIFEHLKT